MCYESDFFVSRPMASSFLAYDSSGLRFFVWTLVRFCVVALFFQDFVALRISCERLDFPVNVAIETRANVVPPLSKTVKPLSMFHFPMIRLLTPFHQHLQRQLSVFPGRSSDWSKSYSVVHWILPSVCTIAVAGLKQARWHDR